MSHITDKLINYERDDAGENGSFLLPLFLALLAVMSALFIGEMLFGKNSLEVYLALEKDQKILEKKINDLKNQNAALQKEYFELKNIMPSKEDE